MLKVKIVCVGKVKEKYFEQGILEYVKRISRFADIKIVEVAEENYKEVNASIERQIKEKEAQRILPNLSGYVIACAIEGKKLSSTALAKTIETKASLGLNEITFVIGGSYGLSDKIKALASEKLSFSL